MNSLPKDLRKHIFWVCDMPATTSVICKQWREESEELIANIASGVTLHFMTPGLESLMHRYTSLLPKFVTEESRKTVLVFRRVVLRQQDEWGHLFSKFYQIAMTYPNIPSVQRFIQAEEAIHCMNEISFSYCTLRYVMARMIGGHGRVAEFIPFASEQLNLYSQELQMLSGASFEELHQEACRLHKHDKTHVQEKLFTPHNISILIAWRNCFGRKAIFPMTRVSQNLEKLQNLRVVEVTHQALRFIPDQLKQLKMIQKLHFRQNQITNFTREIKDLPRLNELDLIQNPLSDQEKMVYNRYWLDLIDPRELPVDEVIPCVRAVKPVAIMVTIIAIAIILHDQLR